MRRVLGSASLILLLCLAATQPSHAVILQSTAGTSGTNTINFEEEGSQTGGTPVTNSVYNALGIHFDNQLFYFTTTQPNESGEAVDPFNGNTAPEPVSLFFNSPVNQASFVMATQDGVTTAFTTFLAGTQVETASFGTGLGQVNDFFNFSGGPFDQIQIDIAIGTHAFLMDNLTFTPATAPPAGAPEVDPSSAVLPVGMLAGLCLLLSDRRAGAVAA